MRCFEARWLAAAIVLFVAAPSVAGQVDSWTGKQVVKRSRAVQLRIGKQVVDEGKDFRIYRVELIQGQWLWIASGNVRGWIRANDAILYDQALSVCTQQIRERPRGSDFILRGNLWFEKTQYEIAIADFSKAIQLDPNDAEAYARRGDARLARLKARAMSLEKQKAAQTAVPDEHDPEVVAFKKEAMGEADLILEDYQSVLAIEPRNTTAFLNSGVAWIFHEQLDRALGCVEEAIRLDPKCSSAYLARSRVWYAKGRETKSLADLDSALRLDPRNIEALEGRVNADDYLGEYDRLIEDASALLKLDPENAHAYILRGNAWSKREQYEKARADYEAALRVDSNNDVASANLRHLPDNTSAKNRR